MNTIDPPKSHTKATENIPQELLDSLSFKSTAKHIEALKQAIFDAPNTNQAKIDFIKNEITSGRYVINSDQIANKLMEDKQLIEQPEIA